MKKLKLAFIMIVLAALLVPSVLMFCGYKNANRENRVLAKLPKLFTEEGFNTRFAAQFDKYVDDNYALREYVVTAFNAADIALLKDVNGTNAVIGKDHNIFYGETVEDYLGINGLTEEQINTIADYLSDMRNKLEERGMQFAFMTAPNKATVYPELMPSYLRPTDAPRNIDLLREALIARGVDYIDAKAILLEAKQRRSVYYRHDSHWNNYGAMLVYNAIAERFGLEVRDPDLYEIVTDRMGDLHNFVYPSTDYPEERIIYPKLRSYTSARPINFDRDKTVETESGANSISLVFYHDSFGRSLQPILSEGVGSLFMTSYFPYDTSCIDERSPDAVLIELVERNLDKLYEHAASLGF
ncbi:MAG: hypothetical protein IKH31_02445 [Clostridia bacterium]|nr:hypothetical protein [Clostridia bacterium]